MLIDLLLLAMIFGGIYVGYHLGAHRFFAAVCLIATALFVTLVSTGFCLRILKDSLGWQGVWLAWLLLAIHIAAFTAGIYQVARLVRKHYNTDTLSEWGRSVSAFLTGWLSTVAFAFIVWFGQMSGLVDGSRAGYSLTKLPLIVLADRTHTHLDRIKPLWGGVERLAQGTFAPAEETPAAGSRR